MRGLDHTFLGMSIAFLVMGKVIAFTAFMLFAVGVWIAGELRYTARVAAPSPAPSPWRHCIFQLGKDRTFRGVLYRATWRDRETGETHCVAYAADPLTAMASVTAQAQALIGERRAAA